MIHRLLATWFARDLERLHFEHQTEDGRRLFRRVFGVVRDGGLLGFSGCAESELLARAAALPWELRPFLHEGHAIGHAGRTACSLGRVSPEAGLRTRANQSIRFLSYGYWIAVAERYPLPSWGLDGGRWRGDPGHERHRALMINGLAFGRVLLAGDLDRALAGSLAESFRGAERWAALHGVGRVLWFLNAGNPERLGRLLGLHREHAEPLAVGLGVAVCFTQVRRPERVLEVYDRLPAELRPWLLSGAGIALRFHAVNDPEAERAVEATLDPRLEPWYLAARARSLEGSGAGTADWVFDRLRPEPRIVAVAT